MDYIYIMDYYVTGFFLWPPSLPFPLIPSELYCLWIHPRDVQSKDPTFRSLPLYVLYSTLTLMHPQLCASQ